MRIELFEAIGPVCPSCLHAAQTQAPLRIAQRSEMRAGLLWHGILHCSNPSCWMEFPVIDGIPIITPDPPETIRRAENQILARTGLPAPIAGILGDALGQGTTFDRDRQHISLYATSHFADWAGEDQAPLPAIIDRALKAMGDPDPPGPALDLGCSVGRGAWELAVTGRLVLGLDLNFAMLRLAQQLLLEGRASYDRRRIGLVYDRVEITVPDEAPTDRIDFWAADCITLPFRAECFALAGAVNLVDCIAAPTNMLHEAARVLAPGSGAFLTTPYDWAETATEKAAWMGGHSGRGPHEGAGEQILTATLAHAGFEVLSEQHDVPWQLRIHARSVMQYDLHMVACRRKGGATAGTDATPFNPESPF